MQKNHVFWSTSDFIIVDMQQSQLNDFNMPPLLLQVKMCEHVDVSV